MSFDSVFMDFFGFKVEPYGQNRPFQVRFLGQKSTGATQSRILNSNDMPKPAGRSTILCQDMTTSFPIRVLLATLLAAATVPACKKAPPPTAESLARH